MSASAARGERLSATIGGSSAPEGQGMSAEGTKKKVVIRDDVGMEEQSVTGCHGVSTGETEPSEQLLPLETA